MLKDEFLNQYHNYQTFSREEAENESKRVNSKAEGFKVVVQDFGNLGYCLMLVEAVVFLKEIGIFE